MRRFAFIALSALSGVAGLAPAAVASRGEGHDAVAICHSGNGKHYVLIEPDDDGVIHGHDDHEYDYDAPDFGDGPFCSDDETPEEPDSGQECPGGITIPSYLECPEEETSTTTSPTTEPTTTTTTSPSSPVESTTTTTSRPSDSGSTSSTTAPSTTPSSLRSAPETLTELPRTGWGETLLVFVGLWFLLGGLTALALAQLIRGAK